MSCCVRTEIYRLKEGMPMPEVFGDFDWELRKGNKVLRKVKAGSFDLAEIEGVGNFQLWGFSDGDVKYLAKIRIANYTCHGTLETFKIFDLTFDETFE